MSAPRNLIPRRSSVAAAVGRRTRGRRLPRAATSPRHPRRHRLLRRPSRWWPTTRSRRPTLRSTRRSPSSPPTPASRSVVNAGDTGTMVTKAALTAGNPEGDVMWGVDNTWLSAATDGDIFDGEPAQVDFGDVCLNYDIAWFAGACAQPARHARRPAAARVRRPAGGGEPEHLVARSGVPAGHRRRVRREGWQQYWQRLRDNGVEVVDSWDIAYYERFSGAAGSDGPSRWWSATPAALRRRCSSPTRRATTPPPASARHLLPPARVRRRVARHRPPDRGTATAGLPAVDEVPAGTAADAVRLPGRRPTPLPEAFTRYSVIADNPYTVEPATIAANREQWQDQWTEIVLR
jgi:thiamine transport system substrate-binding protein